MVYIKKKKQQPWKKLENSESDITKGNFEKEQNTAI